MNGRAVTMTGQLVLGRYRIVKQLARGGMGVVYLARTEGAQGFTRPVIGKRIISDLAEDEHAAHTFVRADGTPMQIVHRDVSPGNILIDTQGHVKLLDFGIARAEESDEYKTRDGLFKGKLSYSAPEVYDGVTGPKSDVYSAGVV